MHIHVFNTEHDVARALARQVARAINDKPTIVLGLPTGRTPVETYHELGKVHAAGRVDLSEVVTFNLDEWVGVGPTHPGSFRRFMHAELFDRVNIRPEHIHFLDGLASDLEAECERYERDITAAGGIDLQLLGIGSNGHIGFNEPYDELHASTHRVRLHEATRRDNAGPFGGDVTQVPHEALSMGMGTIMKTGSVILIATGERKAQVIERALQGPLTTRLPASFLQMHRHVEVYLDAAAASLLSVQDRA